LKFQKVLVSRSVNCILVMCYITHNGEKTFVATNSMSLNASDSQENRFEWARCWKNKKQLYTMIWG